MSLQSTLESAIEAEAESALFAGASSLLTKAEASTNPEEKALATIGATLLAQNVAQSLPTVSANLLADLNKAANAIESAFIAHAGGATLSVETVLADIETSLAPAATP